jgi:cellulose synthase/poly-beta-1,6-N-acetylglucosamine synthase-like glycosyltransferase
VSGLEFMAVLSLLMMIVVWLGYPAIVWVLGSLRRTSPVPLDAPWPHVSVVLVTRESPQSVRARVENCFATGYDLDRFEVVVALDREVEDADYALPALVPGKVRVITGHQGSGKAAALNAGVHCSRGEVLVFADTHQRFDRSTVPNLVNVLRDPQFGAVSGRLIISGGAALLTRMYWRYETWLRRSEARLHSTVGVSGSVCAMRKQLWRPLPQGLLLDDVFAPMQVVLRGLRVGYAADACAIEQRNSAPAGEYRRKVRTLTGVIQLCTVLPEVLSPARNPIWFQFVMHKLMRMLMPVALVIMAIYLLSLGGTLPRDHLLLASAFLMAAALWITRSRQPHAARLRTILVEGTLLQAAILMAGVNGLRGRWDVWNG